MNELLKVEDSFVIEGRGIVLIPDFSIPEGGWTAREEQVRVEMTDGTSHEMMARIDCAHFTLADPHATPNQRNRVVVRLLDASEKLPNGTKVFATSELVEALIPTSA